MACVNVLFDKCVCGMCMCICESVGVRDMCIYGMCVCIYRWMCVLHVYMFM
jgi:hypothetical protein